MVSGLWLFAVSPRSGFLCSVVLSVLVSSSITVASGELLTQEVLVSGSVSSRVVTVSLACQASSMAFRQPLVVPSLFRSSLLDFYSCSSEFKGDGFCFGVSPRFFIVWSLSRQ